MTFLLFLGVLSVVLASIVPVRELVVRKKYGISYGDYKGLSEPSKNLIREYLSLPPSNRPFPNIYRIVSALDIKYGKENANSHFRRPGYEHSYFSWKCGCRWFTSPTEYCTLAEYMDLHNTIQSVMSALEEQSHALQVSAAKDSLNEVEILTARLREERNLVSTVTKELCS